MTDIIVAWDDPALRADFVLLNGELETGDDLQSAVIISLFTDRVASPDFVPTDGTTDRRGWWGDAYGDIPIGSQLWRLQRAEKSNATRLAAEDYAKEALAWLVTDGVAASVDASATWLNGIALVLVVTIIQPDGTSQRLVATNASPGTVTGPSFAWVWESV